ncbi:uncharacterized protein LOC107027691 [Solanum pennellii]|uniref:Uncharacterized protein LOC107027691 n=1 Tax=Solanum pennellii TaxID=28526 RepID=A0ABM1HE94_SOLPN|nr:uncharacterized protein LOC107027691 [Solanum pennellii]
MREGETIHEMFTKLSSITNELRSLGEPISMSKQVRKVLRILPKSWGSKVDAITEAKDLKVLTMVALIGNLKTHEMNQSHDQSKKEDKKDKSLMLKYRSEEDPSDDDDMAYLIKRFQKIVRKKKGFRKGANVPRTATQNDTCHKCRKAGHFIRECPLHKAENKEYQKPRGDKEKQRDLVLDKNDRKVAADYVVKKALAAWGDSSSDSEDLDKPNDVSMVVVYEEETIFNEMFVFMAHSENEDDEDKVTLLDMKHDLNTYSLKKLRTLANVMIDSVIELTSERDIMNAELESLNENRDKMGEKMLKSEDQMVSERSISQCWYMDSGYSKHMTGDIKNFLSLKALQSGGVSFGDGNKGYILGVGKVGKSLRRSIDNVYHVNGLKYKLLSVSQIRDKGNEVKFTSEKSL